MGRVLISILLLFHLSVMWIIPQDESLLHKAVANWALPYAAQLGFASSWRLFSPLPTPATYFRYSVLDGRPLADQDASQSDFVYPSRGAALVRTPSELRELTAMRYFTESETRMREIWGPMICRRHPGARQLQVAHVMDFQPPMTHLGPRLGEELAKIRMQSLSVDCPSVAETDGLRPLETSEETSRGTD